MGIGAIDHHDFERVVDILDAVVVVESGGDHVLHERAPRSLVVVGFAFCRRQFIPEIVKRELGGCGSRCLAALRTEDVIDASGRHVRIPL